MKTLPYKTQASIYAGIFLLLALLSIVAYFIARKLTPKHRTSKITLFVLSALLLVGAVYRGYSAIDFFKKAQVALKSPSDSNTHSNYFEIIVPKSAFNEEGFDVKTNKEGSYILTLKGLKEGKVKLLTGKAGQPIKVFQTVNLEPGETTHVILHLKKSQKTMHLVLEDPNKKINVIDIQNIAK